MDNDASQSSGALVQPGALSMSEDFAPHSVADNAELIRLVLGQVHALTLVEKRDDFARPGLTCTHARVAEVSGMGRKSLPDVRALGIRSDCV